MTNRFWSNSTVCEKLAVAVRQYIQYKRLSYDVNNGINWQFIIIGKKTLTLILNRMAFKRSFEVSGLQCPICFYHIKLRSLARVQ